VAKLRAAIALLPDAELSNRLAAAALGVHAASLGRLRWPRLPPHLSLQQPFAIESLSTVEHLVAPLARELGPFRLTLGALEVQAPSPGSPEAVVWVGVEADPALVELQRQLDGELSPPKSENGKPFVSDAYRFHVTLGFLPGSLEAGTALPSLAGTTATFPELGVFVYDGLPRAGWQCLLYARRSLSRAPGATPATPIVG